jgi:hypothetical protein
MFRSGDKMPLDPDAVRLAQGANQLSRKYLGKDYGNPIGPQGRVILTVAADQVNTPKSARR